VGGHQKARAGVPVTGLDLESESLRVVAHRPRLLTS
jgi:hypothetical protein